MVGTPLHDVITGSDEGEVLAGSGGNNQLTGGGGPDAFFLKHKASLASGTQIQLQTLAQKMETYWLYLKKHLVA